MEVWWKFVQKHGEEEDQKSDPMTPEMERTTGICHENWTLTVHIRTRAY